MKGPYKLLFYMFILNQLKLYSFRGDFHSIGHYEFLVIPEINQGTINNVSYFVTCARKKMTKTMVYV